MQLTLVLWTIASTLWGGLAVFSIYRYKKYCTCLEASLTLGELIVAHVALFIISSLHVISLLN